MVRGLRFDPILVGSPSDPAEAVLIGPALRALRIECPSAVIHLATPPRAEQVARMLPFVDRMIATPCLFLPAQIRMLEAASYKAAILFTDHGRSPYPDAYGCYLAGVPVRVGLSDEFGGGVLSHWVKPVPGAAPVDRHLALVSSIGFPIADRRLELRVPPRTQAVVEKKMRDLGLAKEDSLVSVRCRGTLGSCLPDFLLKKHGMSPISGHAGAPPSVLVGLDTGIVRTVTGSRRETVHGAIAARSALTITDDPTTAYISEAMNCAVLFIERSEEVKRTGASSQGYATVNGKGMVCREDSPAAIVDRALHMMKNCRSS